MAKFVCSVCGYVYEGEEAPAQCPVCKAPAEKFIKQGSTGCTGRYHGRFKSKLPGRVFRSWYVPCNGSCSIQRRLS